jgi:hypothetical protein
MRAAKPILLAAALSAVALVHALAQDRMSIDASARPVRVQVGINFFMPSAVGEENDEASRVREHARRLVYAMASKECAVLQDVLANSCRLEALNVNVNRQAGQPLGGFAVHGSMTYSITLK